MRRKRCDGLNTRGREAIRGGWKDERNDALGLRRGRRRAFGFAGCRRFELREKRQQRQKDEQQIEFHQ